MLIRHVEVLKRLSSTFSQNFLRGAHRAIYNEKQLTYKFAVMDETSYLTFRKGYSFMVRRALLRGSETAECLLLLRTSRSYSASVRSTTPNRH